MTEKISSGENIKKESKSIMSKKFESKDISEDSPDPHIAEHKIINILSEEEPDMQTEHVIVTGGDLFKSDE